MLNPGLAIISPIEYLDNGVQRALTVAANCGHSVGFVTFSDDKKRECLLNISDACARLNAAEYLALSPPSENIITTPVDFIWGVKDLKSLCDG